MSTTSVNDEAAKSAAIYAGSGGFVAAGDGEGVGCMVEVSEADVGLGVEGCAWVACGEGVGCKVDAPEEAAPEVGTEVGEAVLNTSTPEVGTGVGEAV
jgi:hypothetical protein